ncbi:hypothetical protein OS242_18640 [Tumebacillus sp. DT12]|uniref:Uncharacterized protein n=1 Tax=Tumebacillus lacus TaxID=2995335 RepID=A0ABT3X8M9_9BACL|nr:hypothetical protein [Tumebacillus lacus]MCX7571960.1 hypothetical protein [Tumebacillus lacus]
MKETKFHETQPPYLSEAPDRESALDPQIAQLQRIEAGGLLKPVQLSTMPRWLRIGGYVVRAIFVMMLLFGLYMSLTGH